MYLTKLHIHTFRNIKNTEIDLSPNCNLFYGINGSGKTSILEALYYLDTAKSFRCHLSSRVIQHGQEKLTLFAAAQQEQDNNNLGITLGIERFHNGNSKIHVQGKNIESIAEITRLIPMQVIHQNSFELLDAGPKYKRKFIDWGMFHVEHNFLQTWKNYKRTLDQRNAALKTKGTFITDTWDHELAKWGYELYQWRDNYIKELLPIINYLLSKFLGNYTISIDYYPGWNIAENLYDVLQKTIKRDQLFGFTQCGPHRSDLRLLINNIPLQDVLSRGQQKIFVFIMYLAQGILLKNLTNKKSIFLIDDLAAELDKDKQHQVATILQDLGAQIFITALTPECLQDLQATLPNKTFFVEQGMIYQ